VSFDDYSPVDLTHDRDVSDVNSDRFLKAKSFDSSFYRHLHDCVVDSESSVEFLDADCTANALFNECGYEPPSSAPAEGSLESNDDSKVR